MNIQEMIVEQIKQDKKTSVSYTIEDNPDFIHRKEVEEKLRLNGWHCDCVNQESCICTQFKNQQHYGYCSSERFYKVLNAPIVCLCGSTRFKERFFEVAREFTLQGYIVTMPMVFVHSENESISEEQKHFLDEVHKAKIAGADLVYILNCGGYIGASTRSEIEWAEALHKEIKYLE